MNKLTRLLSILLLISLFAGLTACTNEQNAAAPAQNTQQSDAQKQAAESTAASAPQPQSAAAGASASVDAAVPEKLKKSLKIALVTRITSGSFFAQYNKGVKEQVEALGGELKIYDSSNDLAKMASNVEAAINEKVDAILVNNGTAQALAPVVQKALDAGIPVVAYDSDLNLPGVTAIDQDDYLLAWQSLKQMAVDLNGKGNIAVLWVAGYLPMERRQVMLEAFYKRYPNIKEVARFGTVSANTALDVQAQVEALLKKYPEKGQIDAIYTTWDEFTRGAVQALAQAGRSDIKVYGIDLTDEDLQLMMKPGATWVAASATNPSDVGKVQVRLVYQKVAGEPVPDSVQIEPHLVKKELLPANVTFDQLGDYVNGWGGSDIAISPWMDKLKQEVKK